MTAENVDQVKYVSNVKDNASAEKKKEDAIARHKQKQRVMIYYVQSLWVTFNDNEDSLGGQENGKKKVGSIHSSSWEGSGSFCRYHSGRNMCSLFGGHLAQLT